MKKSILLALLFVNSFLYAQIEIADLCTDITSDQTFVLHADGQKTCIEGTFDGAEIENSPLPGHDCLFTEFPTIWFKISLEEPATNIKTTVIHNNQWYPIWSIFYGDDCNNLHQIKSNGFGCSWNSNNFEWDVLTRFNKDGSFVKDYYVAITAEGGFPNPGDNSFNLCVEAYEDTSSCFYKQNFNNPNFGNIYVTKRSCGNSLDGPFFQGEEVTVQVEYIYDAAFLGINSWLQSLIPDFGPGWEPYTRDNLIRIFPNYGTWSDGAFDCPPVSNETIFDMCIYTNAMGQEVICNQLYEDCPCNYEIDEGQMLPPGWFWNTPGGVGCSSNCQTGTSYGIEDGLYSHVFLEFKLRVKQFTDQNECELNSDLYINIQPFNDEVTGCWEEPTISCINLKKFFSPEWKIDCSNIPTDCQQYKLVTEIYYDINENGIKDALEPTYNQGSILIEPLGTVHYPALNTKIYLEEGEYNVYFDTQSTPNWMLTNDSNYYHIVLNADNVCDTVSFGLKPLQQDQELSTNFLLTNDRCNTESKLIANVNNDGQTFESGWLWVKLDLNINEISFDQSPDTMVSTNVYGWKFSNLPPGNQFSQTITITIPGPPTFIPGVFIQFESLVSIENDLNDALDSFLKNVLVRCSYDPNDKQVVPDAENGYTDLDETTLTYTIRFQNTGNAEAYDIIIRDTLSPNLKPSSFKLIKTSHPLTLGAKRQEGNILVFEFNNIYLPDSTTDLEGSQGYITYSIDLKDNLPEGTRVENTAFIYFDQNPPIQTNTTQNEYYNDIDDDGYLSIEDCDDTNGDINPDAIEIANNDVDENCDGEFLIIDEDMDGYNSDEDCDDTNADVNPEAIEIANNDVDENCDGIFLIIDEDMDGFNSDEDCDDNDPTINPDAIEIPNNLVDENCDDEILIIDEDMDGYNSDEDCNDENANVNPDAIEIANNDVDENCDGIFLIIDEDMDGFNSDEDCNDNDPTINPDAVEIPNNLVDENCDDEILIIDEDMDGYNSDEDCDDENAGVNPEALEIPNNGIDEDCDGVDLITSTFDIDDQLISINPNPVNEFVIVKSELIIQNLEVINQNGIVLKSIEEDFTHKRIELLDIPTGIYLLRMKVGNSHIYKKIVRL